MWFQQSTPSAAAPVAPAPAAPQEIKLYKIHVYPAGEKDKRKIYGARRVTLYWEPTLESLNDRVNKLISLTPDKKVYVHGDSIKKYTNITFQDIVLEEPGFCISPPGDTEFWREEGDGIHIFPKSKISDMSAAGKWGGEGWLGDWVLSMNVAGAAGVNKTYKFRMNDKQEYEKAVVAVAEATM